MTVSADILEAWQRLFAVHKKHNLPLPREVWFDRLPDIYNPLLRQQESFSADLNPVTHIAYVFQDNTCLFKEKKK